jgi:steroid 5-alpha reductase family enzyme
MIDQRTVLFLLGLALVAALQGLLYLRQRKTRDATLVDAGWAFSLAFLAVLYALLAPGSVEHRLVVGVLGSVEFARVGWLVTRRLGGREDTRYAELRERWRSRGREQASFAVFFQAQALVAAILSLPFLLASFNPNDGLAVLEWVGIALWVTAFAGEWLADRQLATFKADPSNKGTTMRGGLWRYSRHPNYFFQWLIWVAFALIALPAPYGWLGLVAPALMLVSILFVTGIPPSEEQALRSRGDDYRRYQRETSAFVPLPRRRPTEQ